MNPCPGRRRRREDEEKKRRRRRGEENEKRDAWRLSAPGRVPPVDVREHCLAWESRASCSLVTIHDNGTEFGSRKNALREHETRWSVHHVTVTHEQVSRSPKTHATIPGDGTESGSGKNALRVKRTRWSACSTTRRCPEGMIRTHFCVQSCNSRGPS